MQLIKSIKAALGLTKIESIASQYIIQTYNQSAPAWGSWKVLRAYKILDDIFSVVNRIATTAATVPIYGYNSELEYLANTDRLSVFLKSLTYIKRVEMFTWLELRGECFVWMDSTLGVNGTINKVYFLNPNFITVALTRDFPQDIVAYRYCDAGNGVDITIPAEDMIFIKNFNPSDNYLEAIRGLAKVDVLWQRLTRMESNMKNSVSQMQNGGVPGIVFIEDLPQTGKTTAADGYKNNFANYLKNSDNKGAPFFAGNKMGWLPMGLSLVDLDSIELERIDFKKICNVWAVSDRLFNNDATGSEISDDNAYEGLYTNAVIPLLTMVEDAFNTELVVKFGSGDRQVKFDVSEVWVLQKIKLEKVKAMSMAMVNIPNDVLELLGYERNPDPLMDMPWIKSGHEPLDSFEQLPPVV